MVAIKRILVPIDFSSSSRQALDHAVQLAQALGASVEVLHVHEASPYVGPDTLAFLPVDLTDDRWEEMRGELTWELAHFVGTDRARGLDVTVERGVPGDVIAQVARAHGADLIIMGTHGRTGLSRLVVGSVAETVMRRAPCPVMTVRVPAVRPVREAIPL